MLATTHLLKKLNIDYCEEQDLKISPEFLKAINLLNEQQLKAVRNTQGPSMVIAGPGTGKTQILSSRIGKILLESDIKPENILCLTFTDAGATAIKERLVRFFGTKTTNVSVHTFHSFCARLLSEHRMIEDLESQHMISAIERRRLIKDILKSVPFHTPLKNRFSSIYLRKNLENFFNTIKNEGYKKEEFEHHWELDRQIELAKKDYIYQKKYKEFNAGDLKTTKVKDYLHKVEISKQAFPLYEKYEKWLNENKKMEFSDLILNTIELFETDENFSATYQEQFQYIMIDEFQDTNGAQLKLAECLLKGIENPNIMIVGDDDQSIYRFQGANIANIHTFYQKYLSGYSAEEQKERIIVLKENYRSTPAILKASETLIQNNLQRIIRLVSTIPLSKELIPSNPELKNLDHKIEILELPNIEQESMYWALRCEKWKNEGEDLSEIAFLFDKNSEIQKFSQYLSTLGVAYSYQQPINILQSKFTLSIIELMKYAKTEVERPYSGGWMLSNSFFNDYTKLSAYEITKTIADFHTANEDKNEDHKINLREFLLHYTESTKIQNWYQITEDIILKSKQMPLLRFFDYLIESIGVQSNIQQHPEAITRFEEWHTLRKFIEEQLRVNPKMDLGELIALIDEMKEEEIPIQLVRTYSHHNAVKLITFHGSKGLEFGRVILIHQSKKKKNNQREIYIPNTLVHNSSTPEELAKKTTDEAITNMEEARRLFYVGMTRAKKHLYISYFTTTSSTSDKDKAQFPEDFIKEIPEELTTRSKIELTENDLLRFAKVPISEKENNAYNLYKGDFISKKIKNMKLSVTALNNYLKCPREFYYNNILRIPTYQNPQMIFGIVFHNALELFFKAAVVNNAFGTEEFLVSLIETELQKRKYLFTPEEYAERLDYAKVLVPIYFQKTKDWWHLDTLPEEQIDIEWEGIPLTGKIDKIDKLANNQINIVDFKTGSLKYSEKKLREPKNLEIDQGGDYWRQGIFYYILISNKYPNYHINQVLFEYSLPDKENIVQRKQVNILPEYVELVKKQIKESYQKIQAMDFKGCQKEDCEYCKNY